MRFLMAVTVGVFSLACSEAPPFASRRIAYGTYELTCKTTLAACLERVDDVCHGTAYDVVSAHDRRRPIDAAFANFQHELRASDAIVHCDMTKPLFGGGGEPPAPPAGAAEPQGTPRQTARACVPGATQVCVGPAACSGGQACLADGSGFGPCACGPGLRAHDAGSD